MSSEIEKLLTDRNPLSDTGRLEIKAQDEAGSRPTDPLNVTSS